MIEREQLKRSWKRHGENPQDPKWQRLHTRVTRKWRREGEILPNFSSPEGWDMLCKKVAELELWKKPL